MRYMQYQLCAHLRALVAAPGEKALHRDRRACLKPRRRLGDLTRRESRHLKRCLPRHTRFVLLRTMPQRKTHDGDTRGAMAQRLDGGDFARQRDGVGAQPALDRRAA